MSLASKTRPISHVLYDERSRQVLWSLETGFAKSTGSSCNSPRLGIWLLTSIRGTLSHEDREEHCRRWRHSGHWLGGRPHISPAKRSSWTVTTLVNATAQPKPSSLFL